MTFIIIVPFQVLAAGLVRKCVLFGTLISLIARARNTTPPTGSTIGWYR
jgi:hypothetical protein